MFNKKIIIHPGINPEIALIALKKYEKHASTEQRNPPKNTYNSTYKEDTGLTIRVLFDEKFYYFFVYCTWISINITKGSLTRTIE